MYKIEIRDSNGRREIYEFETRDDFYTWAVELRDSGVAYDMEVLWVSFDGMILYSELFEHGFDMLDWDALIGFIA